MNARPVPMAETHKLALLDWLRSRARYGQGCPSDRDIARRLGLRTTDDAMALVQALAADGDIAIESDGNFRRVVLTVPVTLAGTQPLTRDMVAAANAAVPLPAGEPVARRGKPAPISIAPTRPLFVPVVPALPSAPIAAPVPAPVAPPSPPEDADMTTAAATPNRHQIKVTLSENDRLLADARARKADKPLAAWVRDVIRSQLLASSPVATLTPPAGKFRLSARVIRIATADKRGFWPAVTMMIELGATALADQQGRP